ncbi:P-II family nitrogen regulator [Microcella alkaliphila]|jgi:nitrogen regulatory protein PII|uniref:Nitrogen regulatory protein PII n=1 Tax=Microcella alkaliphila TaxID=279828 RepID=A0A0U5BAN4_9MICO|nr:transcriptional regulator [Microcella alkaliphila]BAU31729.1 nitrogen regulatory protein PII [Microcella alkaliphila]
MTVEGLSPMTKVEVVVRSTDADAVSRQIVSAGATGYTSLPGVTGLGHHGAHDGRALFNDQDALTLTITVVPDDRAPALIAGLRELLERRPGVMFVSTVSVSRPHYFQ